MPPEQQRKRGRPYLSDRDVSTRDHILDVAAQLFLEYGYKGVSTKQVAEKCGVTKAMAYYYFSSKTDLFTTSIAKMMDNIRLRTVEILARAETLYDRLVKIAIARLQVKSKLDMNVLLKEAEPYLTEDQIHEVRMAEEKLMDTLAEAFENASYNGELRALNGRFAARIYVNLLSAGMSHELDYWDSENKAHELLQVLWHGIAQNSSASDDSDSN